MVSCPSTTPRPTREGVSRTYKKVDCYASIFAYLGQEGYLINCELREGKHYSGKGFPAFPQQTLKLTRRVTEEKVLIRLDSAHDDIKTVRICEQAPKVDYLIKRNLRHESKEHWLREAQAFLERQSGSG